MNSLKPTNQSKLEGRIDILLNNIFDLLKNEGYNVTLLDEEIILKFLIKELEIQIRLVLPKFYPYEFIEIFLLNSVELPFLIPHRMIGDQLCLFDDGEDLPDFENHENEAINTVTRAIGFLNDCAAGKYDDEYEQEFIDINKDNSKKVFLTLNEYSKPSKLYCQHYYDDNKMIRWASYNEEKLLNLTSYSQYSASNVTVESFYMPLDKNAPKSPLKSTVDVLELVKDEKYESELIKYITDNISKRLNLFVIFGFQTPTNTALIAVQFPEIFIPKTIKMIREKQARTLLKQNVGKKMIKFHVDDVSQKRMFTRGGDGKSFSNKSAYITGCGSAGSFLAKAITDSGVCNKLTLQDNQLLLSENLGRHLCSLSSVDKPKAIAVKEELIKHYPSLEIEFNTDNFYKTLKLEDFSSLENIDYFFLTVGNENIEKRVIQLITENKITTKTIIIWVEPFLVAGHALFLNSEINSTALSQIFDDNGHFKIGILEKPSEFSKSEAGCQSYFAPYSGFEMQNFINSIVRDIIHKPDLTKEGVFSYTYLGNLSQARRDMIGISEYWRGCDDYSIHIRRLDE